MNVISLQGGTYDGQRAVVSETEYILAVLDLDVPMIDRRRPVYYQIISERDAVCLPDPSESQQEASVKIRASELES